MISPPKWLLIVNILLCFRCLSCGYDSDFFIFSTIAMADNTNTFPIGHTYNQKPIFFFRMIRIIKQNRIFILENGLSLFERNPMLFLFLVFFSSSQ